MTDIVLLDNVAHAELRIVPQYGAACGDSVNQLLIFPSELQAAQREYPILLIPDDQGALQLVAIVGLSRDENLFLDGGHWDARYVPAIQRRGPFIIGFRDAEQTDPVIEINLDDPRVRLSGGDGHAVFLRHGGNAPYLEQAIATLRSIHLGVAAAPAMFAVFAALDLIEPAAIEIKLSETDQINFQGYSTISADRLAALDGAGLDRLNRSGHLAMAVHIIASLDNFSNLIDRHRRRFGPV